MFSHSNAAYGLFGDGLVVLRVHVKSRLQAEKPRDRAFVDEISREVLRATSALRMTIRNKFAANLAPSSPLPSRSPTADISYIGGYARRLVPWPYS